MNKAVFCSGWLALAIALAATPAPAQDIELALNLIFSDPTDDTSGGEWQVIVGTDNFGLRSVSFALSGINPTVLRSAPFGTVNSSDDAGFAFFEDFTNATATSIIVGHVAPPMTGEAGEFFGFGTLFNGSPNLPGAEPAGVSTIGPEITTLTGLSGIPFATGDLFDDSQFDTFATLATGTFEPGETPEFFVTPTNTSGTVFTALPGSAAATGFPTASATAPVSILDTRSNLVEFSDFNGDGVVSVADYVIFRDSFGQTVAPGSGADGDGSSQIDAPDFDIFLQDFGLPDAAAPATLAAAAVVPEPMASTLMLLATSGFFARRGYRRPAARGPRRQGLSV